MRRRVLTTPKARPRERASDFFERESRAAKVSRISVSLWPAFLPRTQRNEHAAPLRLSGVVVLQISYCFQMRQYVAARRHTVADSMYTKCACRLAFRIVSRELGFRRRCYNARDARLGVNSSTCNTLYDRWIFKHILAKLYSLHKSPVATNTYSSSCVGAARYSNMTDSDPHDVTWSRLPVTLSSLRRGLRREMGARLGKREGGRERERINLDRSTSLALIENLYAHWIHRPIDVPRALPKFR